MNYSIVIEAYKRIRKAYSRGEGVRLSAKEIFEIWNYDSAIRDAVEQDDLRDRDAQQSKQKDEV